MTLSRIFSKTTGIAYPPTSLFAFDEDGGILLGDLAERIKVAHECETASKDEEILNLRKSLARVMEVTGDCRKCEECGDETCPWFGEPDGCNNREGRALFLAGKLVDPLKKKDAEITKLRAALRPVLAVCPNSYESHFIIGGCWRVPIYNGKLCEAAVLEAQRIYNESEVK